LHPFGRIPRSPPPVHPHPHPCVWRHNTTGGVSKSHHSVGQSRSHPHPQGVRLSNRTWHCGLQDTGVQRWQRTLLILCTSWRGRMGTYTQGGRMVPPPPTHTHLESLLLCWCCTVVRSRPAPNPAPNPDPNPNPNLNQGHQGSVEVACSGPEAKTGWWSRFADVSILHARVMIGGSACTSTATHIHIHRPHLSGGC
jgi:hypothetical protein